MQDDRGKDQRENIHVQSANQREEMRDDPGKWSLVGPIASCFELPEESAGWLVAANQLRTC